MNFYLFTLRCIRTVVDKGCKAFIETEVMQMDMMAEQQEAMQQQQQAQYA